jgi:hypothetical protein
MEIARLPRLLWGANWHGLGRALTLPRVFHAESRTLITRSTPRSVPHFISFAALPRIGIKELSMDVCSMQVLHDLAYTAATVPHIPVGVMRA